MPSIDLSILNQRQTPAFYADTLANRPAAGFVGRIFVSTNTYAFYRDNGTSWDLIGGPGTGTVTGSGANGQVTFWDGASSISGSNNLFWDNVNGHLGIKTITPTSALDVNHNGTLIASFNNTSSVNSLIGFKNAGNEQWWIGTENTNDDFLFYDATNFPTLTLRTTFKTSGQVLIGGGSTGSGKLVVESATSDNGIQIVGANAPSLRIDNANTGATLRIGLGISTGTNNFIQGSASGNMCVFNGSTTASPMLFGIYDTTNVAEAARISAARNFIIGKTTDSGQKLQVQGTAIFSNTVAAASFDVANGNYFRAQQNSGGTYQVALGYEAGTDNLLLNFSNSLKVKSLLGSDLMTITSVGNVGIGITPTATTNYNKLQISGTSGGIIDLLIGSTRNFTIYNSSSGAVLGSVTNIPLTLQTNDTTRLTIDGSSGVATFSNVVFANSYYSYFTGGGQTLMADESSRAAVLRAPGLTYGYLGQVGTSTNHDFAIIQFNSPVITIPTTKNVLIGTTTDAGQKLQVNGDVRGNIINSENGTTASLGIGGSANITTINNLSWKLVQANGDANTTNYATAIAYCNSVGGVTIIPIGSSGLVFTSSGANQITVTNGGTAQTISWTTLTLK